MGCHFITTGSNQAKDLDVFDTITETDEPKPKVIYDALLKLNYGEILVYCDAGIHVNPGGRDRFLEYKLMLDTKPICAFSTTSMYKCKYYVKSDAVMSYFPEFNSMDLDYFYAGCMLLKKNDQTVQFMEEWLKLCENHHFIDGSPSYNFKEYPYFHGQDADNGLYALCLCKHINLVHRIDPNEINVYDNNGVQVGHIVNPSLIDWSPLDKFPFQYRRNTPRASS